MTTPRLGLETVPSNTLQPSVPVNDTLQALDVLVQASVVQALRNTPPSTTDADAGVAYILGDNPTGAWLGKGFNIAVCTAADTWRFIPPKGGMTVYVQDQGIHFVNHGTGWAPMTRVDTKTASHQLAVSDRDVILMDSASANAVSIQSELLVPIPIGRAFRIVQKGAGATSVTAESGVTIRTAGSLTLGTQYASGILQKVASDEWVWIVNGAGSASETKGADIASAATTDIGASTGQFVHVTGTTTITSLGTAPAGTRRVVRFAGSLTLTHNATSLILPGGSNITTAANDVATFISEGSGNWRLATYLPASGATITAVAGPTSATADAIALFDGTTGKLIKDSGETVASIRRIPQNSQSAAYTLVLADAGRHILHPSADTAARTFTIPANSSVAFPVGTVVTFVNQNAAGTLTIAITTDTLRLAGADTTGSRTLAANGIATAIKVASTEWLINGTGLT